MGINASLGAPAVLLGEIISWFGVRPDPRNVKAIMDMSSSKLNRELQVFWGILNYLSTFSPKTTEICKPLRKLTSVKSEW